MISRDLVFSSQFTFNAGMHDLGESSWNTISPRVRKLLQAPAFRSLLKLALPTERKILEGLNSMIVITRMMRRKVVNLTEVVFLHL